MKAGDWIRVEDKLPKIGQQVLICHEDGTTYLAELTNNDEVWIGDGFLIPTKNAPYWMPIVKPSKDTQTRLAELAEMVLDMRARQIEVYKMEKMARYASGKVDRDTYEQAVYELKRLQSQVEEECRDILGMEEEQ